MSFFQRNVWQSSIILIVNKGTKLLLIRVLRVSPVKKHFRRCLFEVEAHLSTLLRSIFSNMRVEIALAYIESLKSLRGVFHFANYLLRQPAIVVFHIASILIHIIILFIM